MAGKLACGLLVASLVLLAGRAEAQIGWTGYGYGSQTGWGGTSPWLAGGARAGLYRGYGGIGGYGGPRAVTWYTPGLGYSSNMQTGLPWHEGVMSRPPRAYSPNAMGDSSSIARQERAYRRMETMYAVQRMNRERLRRWDEKEALLAASSKESKNGKSKDLASTQKKGKSKRPTPPLLVDDEPSRVVPFEKRPTSTPESQPTVTSPASDRQPESK